MVFKLSFSNKQSFYICASFRSFPKKWVLWLVAIKRDTTIRERDTYKSGRAGNGNEKKAKKAGPVPDKIVKREVYENFVSRRNDLKTQGFQTFLAETGVVFGAKVFL